ncbi:MAG: glycosyl hydrolase family 65 protein [Antricoccus sp.]
MIRNFTARMDPVTSDVSTEAAFAVEPWLVREFMPNMDDLGHAESVFALSNGHIGVRGNLDEGDPSGLPGTYLNSFYETRPLPYAEAGYGYPESGQTIVNVTNGKLIRLLVDDQPFDLRYGIVRHHERTLDMKTGLLHRDVLWETPSRHQVRVRSTRLVSFTQRAILAIRYEVEAVNVPIRVVVQSELVTNEELPTRANDPRVAAALDRPLESEAFSSHDNRSLLMHRTRNSGLRMAAACDHVIHNSDLPTNTYIEPDWSRTTVGSVLEPGEKLGLTKFVAYGWSSARTIPALRDQVDAALSSALHTGWDGLVSEQLGYVDDFWDGADVEIDGDPVVQQAIRFGLWHVLQAGARAEGRAIPAKGLTGPGYDGHAFWDTESFVLPVLTATAPLAARDELSWRLSIAPLARERAETLKLKGATFPWRTIDGRECSAYWPAGTAAFHINADIAVAAARYVFWTGDEEFDRDVALPLLVDTARLWADLGYHGDDGKFHIDGVTGPDEYTAVVDDNMYTNLMAAQNLRYAADVCERWSAEAAAMDVSETEIAQWREADDAMAKPFDERKDLYQQDRGSTDREVWDFETTSADDYPLLLSHPYFSIYRKQVVKQADLILAMHWAGDNFTLEQKARAFEYYEALTVRDSSLSACVQAVIAAEVGQWQLAHAYLMETALVDLRDLSHNTRDGVHIASLAGIWLALVCGFGGMRDHGGHLSFNPALPSHMARLCFTVHWHGCKLRVNVCQDQAIYTLDDGPDGHTEITHCGQTFMLTVDAPVTMDLQPVTPLTEAPKQPPGRAPRDDL